ncbi:MAG TPA: PAS domain S-box protein, partial [Dissulfurispiraceae bacterium]|nr:PAS domain S-box protein [Dissulfurispiraceae bacterium]
YGFQNLDELVGQSIFDHWSPEYREIIRERAQKRARGEPVSSEYDALGQRKDGSRFPVHIVVESVELPDGKAFMAFLSDITDRKQFEDAVLKLSQAVEQSPVSIVITDIQGNMEFVNSKFTQMTGYNREEVLGKNPRILKTDHTPHEEYQRLWATITSGKVWAGEFLNRKKNGELFWEYATISPIMNSAGVITNYLGIKEDITQRKHLEAQLMQSQKLEALGQLTGGIAHDFNNMLTAIIGYGSLLRTKLEKDSSLKPFIDQILSSAEKSANLTQQLLAFSRKQIIEPKETDLNELIKGIEKLLLRLIGEDIDFKTQLEDKALTVMVDPSQIEQVLMNLCTNARDAMPDGGFLSITTDTAEMKEDNVKTYGLAKPGPYASISVTDSGKGMDEKTLERIFDPFFTTKELGKGTGLGLSIAYGIIKQHGGYITAYSEPGKGTTFRIYLPMLESKAVGAENTEVVAAKGGTETILIAEDNEDVRIVTRQVLEVAGYSVIEALDGEDAIGKFVKDKDNIHLVILDVIMPKKSGREVFDEIRKFKPYVRVLFSSGYTADVISRKSIMEDGMDFISKPAHPGKLLRKVREILDRRSR